MIECIKCKKESGDNPKHWRAFDNGNGWLPIVKDNWFYFCPECKNILMNRLNKTIESFLSKE
jgi:hypothetical protein